MVKGDAERGRRENPVTPSQAHAKNLNTQMPGMGRQRTCSLAPDQEHRPASLQLMLSKILGKADVEPWPWIDLVRPDLNADID